MLLFKSLTSSHSGIYTCVVSNTAGKANTSAELAIKGGRECCNVLLLTYTRHFLILWNISVPPFWQVEPTDTAVLLNGSLTVSCEARGHPPPSIYWTKYSGKSDGFYFLLFYVFWC